MEEGAVEIYNKRQPSILNQLQRQKEKEKKTILELRELLYIDLFLLS